MAQQTPQPIMPMAPQSAPMPMDMTAQESQLNLDRGSQFLFRFPQSHGNSVYAYDKNDNVYVPFQSTLAFHAAMGMDPATAHAEGYIHDLTTPPIPGTFIPDEYGIGNDGQISPQGLAYIQGKLRSPSSANSGSGQGGYSGRGGPSDGKGAGSPTFTSYGKFADSPTVYGLTSDGKLVAFETWDQFTSSGGDASKIGTMVHGSGSTDTNVANAVPYSQYAASLNPVANNPGATSSSAGSTTNTSTNSGGYTFYGQTQDSNKDAVTMQNLTSVFGLWVQKGDITQATYNNIALNPTNLANYTHAFNYGGYQLPDIYADIKAQELGMPAGTAISNTQPASSFQNTPQYASVKSNSQLTMPSDIASNAALLSSNLATLPASDFQTLVAPVGGLSPTVQSQIYNIQNQASDLALQQLNATTTSEKAVADQNYTDWKNYIQNTYGFALANDATSAWGQLQQMSSQSEQGYTVNSGATNAAQDMALNQRRIYDAQLRTSKTTQEDMQQRNYLLSTGTPDEIAALTPQQRQDWGLTPSTDLTNYLNNLQTQYPTMTAAEAAAIKNMYVDPNGNMRSTLYTNLYTNTYNQIYGADANSRMSQNTATYLGQNATAAQQAESAAGVVDPTDAASPFLPQTGKTPNTSSVPTPTSPSTSTSQSQGLQMPSGYPASTPTTQSQSQPQGLQMPSGNSSTASSSSNGLQMPSSSSSNPTFTSYVKTANSPTVYGVTASGQNVAFENSDQFLNSGGNWGSIKNVNSVSNPVNYSQYKPPGS